jgi:hypothetical protein
MIQMDMKTNIVHIIVTRFEFHYEIQINAIFVALRKAVIYQEKYCPSFRTETL